MKPFLFSFLINCVLFISFVKADPPRMLSKEDTINLIQKRNQILVKGGFWALAEGHTPPDISSLHEKGIRVVRDRYFSPDSTSVIYWVKNGLDSTTATFPKLMLTFFANEAKGCAPTNK